jgi:spore maturation protein CgeB
MRGRYNDILEADRHYIPLAPDLADAPTAIERFHDPAERRRIANDAYEVVQECHTYRRRLAALHETVSAG